MDKQLPKIVVGCFILNDKNEILLVKSYKWPGKWVVMGGHIEWGEKYQDTVVREAMEELGLTVVFGHVIEAVQFVFDPNFHDQKHFVGLQCLCHVVGDPTLKLDNDEIQEAKWFSLSEAIKLSNLLDVTRGTISKILDEKLV
jgi:ADP-ribose pyrophosphatase YjhB (NUDIX family)